ncbi:MAG: ABC transporter permease [Bacteroidetes bacterium]|nr:ABC transporter permease [Bacteroidales bacterium]NJO68748.1 ABC transporter permease [Bacteroidota bacterium]
MRTIGYIIRKEFIQIFRNRSMLPIIFIMPVVQLIILANAATLDLKQINMIVVDEDMSQSSRALTSKFAGSPFYNIKNTSFSVKDAEEEILEGTASVILRIPNNFEKDLMRENEAKIQLLVDAINGVSAGLANAYSNAIVADFNKEIVSELVTIPIPDGLNKNIVTIPYYWYNPQLSYKNFMVPGILGILITMIGMFLACMNLVREKEIGTIEQINVTPIHKYQFLAGKLLPFWIIALCELAFGLAVGKLLFNIPFLGSIFLLFGFSSLYLLVILSFGLFISTFADTQQQAMFVSWFIAMVFIMMSGLFTAVENMPDWAQLINTINPIAYFMRVVRMIMLKGSELKDIVNEIIMLTGYFLVISSLAIWRYKKIS